MYSARWTKRARQGFDRLKASAEKACKGRQRRGQSKSSKQEGLYKQVCKTVRLLQSSPRHSGLQTHEFLSLTHPYDAKQKVFEAYAQHRTPGAYRVFWCYGPKRGEITIIAITSHP